MLRYCVDFGTPAKLRYLLHHQYYQVNLYKDAVEYNPSDRLLRHRRNLIVSGSIVAFYFLAGLHDVEFNGALLRGEIEREYWIPLFLVAIFFYNFIQFGIHLSEQKAKHYHSKDLLNWFLIGVAVEVAKLELAEVVKGIKYEEWQPQNLVWENLKGNPDAVSISFQLGGIETDQRLELERRNFSFQQPEGDASFEYHSIDADRNFFYQHQDYFVKSRRLRVVDYNLPMVFGGIVLAIVGLEIVAAAWRFLSTQLLGL